MTSDSFRALIVVEEMESGRFAARVGQRQVAELPPGEVLIRVAWSSVNYKDALSAAGHRGVTRRYPHTPGIDAAGTVLADSSGRFATGSEVLVTGFDLGMNTAGGFAERIRVPADWVLPLPAGMSQRQSMLLGTAGLTAALCVMRLQLQGVTPDSGPVLVTGGSGGVGSCAILLLAKLGYPVAALNGRTDRGDWLRQLGASEIVSPTDLGLDSDKPLLRGRWAGAVDTLGGPVLAAILKTLLVGGTIAACGNAAGAALNTSVFPFILNGAVLAGIHSGTTPMADRVAAWRHLADDWRLPQLETLVRQIDLEQLPTVLAQMLTSHDPGRCLVRLEG